MRQTQRVVWAKGALLSPQQLQTQDRFVEDLIEFRLTTLLFQPFGFSQLRIDHEALAGGSLALTSAAGLFPDGLAFEMPESDPLPPPKPIEEHWPADTATLDVYLAIPEHRIGGHNVSGAHAQRDSRYVAEVSLRRDENTGMAEVPITLAQKRFRLLAGSENLEGNAVVPVARLRRTAAGGVELDPRFVPPLVDIGASEYLLALTRRLVEILSARSTTLSGMRRHRNEGLAHFGVADVANFWLLYTINSHLPRFRHIFEVRRGHPQELFSAMLALAGALTTFSSAVDPRTLPAYDHLALGASFEALDETLRHLLDTVVPATHVALPLQVVRAYTHAVALDQERYFAAPQIYLAVAAGTAREEAVRKAPQLIKVSSADGLERLVRQALSGVRLQHVPNPPNSVPVKLGYEYFLLERSGPEWQAIELARNLAAYVPSDFGESALELVIVLPAAGR
jgi:type VI secretion system protein ImpJ